jgi:5'-3' exonuclease
VPAGPLLLVVDGNSLVHRAYHAASTGKHLDTDGRPVWAIHGLVGHVARAAAMLRPDGVLVGFDCLLTSARKADFAGYKAHRPPKPADLVEQLAAAPEILRAAAVPVVVPPAYEADDVLASAAAAARTAGWRCVALTSDRDAFALIDDTTSVLRVRNGGMENFRLVTAATMPESTGVEAWQYQDLAVLRGDPSDNLPGIGGFGTTTATRLLAAFGSVDAALAALDAGRGDELREAVGDRAATQFGAAAARETVQRNRRLMRMRTDLPLPELDTVRLPLDYGVLRRALGRRGIVLGPSLWALTGRDPLPMDGPRAEDRPSGADRPPRQVRQHVPPRRRVGSAAARRIPVEGQLALF